MHGPRVSQLLDSAALLLSRQHVLLLVAAGGFCNESELPSPRVLPAPAKATKLEATPPEELPRSSSRAASWCDWLVRPKSESVAYLRSPASSSYPAVSAARTQ